MASAKRSRTEISNSNTHGERDKQQKRGTATAAPSQSTRVMLMEDPKTLRPPLNLPQALVTSCLKGDVLLVCKGNKAVQCHSQILACASVVIGDMLESTGALICGNNSTNGLVSIPMIEDEAEHWLQVLVHLYPLPMPGADLTPAQAMAAATLSHKYNIAKLAAMFDQWLEYLQSNNPCYGHYKHVIPNFADCLEAPSVSPIFRAAGAEWRLQVNLLHDEDETVTDVSAYLLPEFVSVIEERTATIAIALVNHLDPVVQSVVCACPKQVLNNDSYYEYLEFAPIRNFEDAAKGYIKDDSVELHVTILVEPSAGRAQKASKKCFLSGNPKSDLYVFRWLELAGKVKNRGLEDKCMEFVRSNAHQAMFDKQFARDLLGAMTGMTTGQAISVMRSLQL